MTCENFVKIFMNNFEVSPATTGQLRGSCQLNMYDWPEKQSQMVFYGNEPAVSTLQN